MHEFHVLFSYILLCIVYSKFSVILTLQREVITSIMKILTTSCCLKSTTCWWRKMVVLWYPIKEHSGCQRHSLWFCIQANLAELQPLWFSLWDCTKGTEGQLGQIIVSLLLNKSHSSALDYDILHTKRKTTSCTYFFPFLKTRVATGCIPVMTWLPYAQLYCTLPTSSYNTENPQLYEEMEVIHYITFSLRSLEYKNTHR